MHSSALKNARETGQAATLMFALAHAALTHILCGNYAARIALLHELVALADEKGTPLLEGSGTRDEGCLWPDWRRRKCSSNDHLGAKCCAANGIYSWVRHCIYRVWRRAMRELGQFDDAWRCIGEAMNTIETTKESWCEAEVNRVAGEIALKSPEPDAAKAEIYFERALAVARQQQAKSWELRAAMSLARLWRDQGKVQQARELLAPVYGWFTEGFDTRDLKEAKALLAELAA